MHSHRGALVIITATVLTFAVVFSLLQASRLAAAPGQAGSSPSETASTQADLGARSADSVEPAIAAGMTAVGVPMAGAEPLLRDVQTGDRLDVLASLAAGRDGRPVTAVVVRGATVLRGATSADPLLLEVQPTDAMVLAHLVLGNTPLGFVVWPAGASPPEPRPIDEQTARTLLGLSTAPTPGAEPLPPAAAEPTAAPSAPPPTPLPAPAPAATAAVPGAVGGFIYQAQPADSWASVAATFGLTERELRQWNDAADDTGLAPGTLLIIPRRASR